MSTDPRIEAAARALDPEVFAVVDSFPLNGPTPVMRARVRAIRRATEAIAAIDRASIITEQEQLDAVPAGSVLIDSYRVHLGGDVYLKDSKGTYWQAGPQGEFKTIQLPARVLHRGTE